MDESEGKKSNGLPPMLESLLYNLKANKNVIYNPQRNIPILIEMAKKYVKKDKRAEELLQLLENVSSKGENNNEY